MSWVYIESGLGRYCVGHYGPQQMWFRDSDHDTPEKAAERCSFLNGGQPVAPTPPPAEGDPLTPLEAVSAVAALEAEFRCDCVKSLGGPLSTPVRTLRRIEEFSEGLIKRRLESEADAAKYVLAVAGYCLAYLVFDQASLLSALKTIRERNHGFNRKDSTGLIRMTEEQIALLEDLEPGAFE